MNNSPSTTHYGLVPFPIIVDATKGDPCAMNYILLHYTGYIMELSKRPMLNNLGYIEPKIDYEMKNRLEAKLITKILNFNIA